VPESQVQDWKLSVPKKTVQLISPPPSPPETWKGWEKEESPPPSPPRLEMDPNETVDAKTLELRLLHAKVYSALEKVEQEQCAQDMQNAPPTITIQAPPDSKNHVPQGFKRDYT